MKIHQWVPAAHRGDAIGDSARAVRDMLRAMGHESDIFALTIDDDMRGEARPFAEAAAGDGDITIFHFALPSPMTEAFARVRGTKVLQYHNITPASFFAAYDPGLFRLAALGRRELATLAGRVDLALGDSEFNRQELAALGFPATGVLPVVPDFVHLDVEPDRSLAADFDDEWTNVMFVGRVIPNKKFEDVIRAFHAYRTRHNPRSRLLLVGSYSGFERYLSMLHALIATLGTPDVHFLGHVRNEELTALYDVADLFLCQSEHEGFCVPLIEAFYKQVPVLAYAATAVPATMDGGGVLHDNKDPLHVAEVMAALLDDPALADAVIASQDAALARLRGRDFGGTLLRFVEETLKRPPRPAPEVSWDFWAQYEQFERLEELRQFRPALYNALPRQI